MFGNILNVSLWSTQCNLRRKLWTTTEIVRLPQTWLLDLIEIGFLLYVQKISVHNQLFTYVLGPKMNLLLLN